MQRFKKFKLTEKHAGGRPTKYTPEVVKIAREYLVNYETEHGHVMPSVVGMALVLNITKTTLYDWAKQEGNEFSDILAKCMNNQEFTLLDKGLKNEINSNITKLALGKHGYHDKQDTSLAAGEGVSINMNFGNGD